MTGARFHVEPPIRLDNADLTRCLVDCDRHGRVARDFADADLARAGWPPPSALQRVAVREHDALHRRERERQRKRRRSPAVAFRRHRVKAGSK